MKPGIQVLLPTDWSNVKRGDFFENLVSELMQRMRYRVVQRVRFTGMEVDCLAENLDTKERAYVECKFVKDPYEADFIPKMIGNAIEQDSQLAYLFSTAVPNREARGKVEEIRRKGNLVGGILRVAFVGPDELVEMYLQLKGFPSFEILFHSLPNHLQTSIGSVTLVIVPEESCWVVEQVRAGTPVKAYIIPTLNPKGSVNDFETIKALIEDARLWIGLELQNGFREEPTRINNSLLSEKKEVVTTVPSADKFEDYRPARPEDFVGRTELIKEVFEFLTNVRNRGTSTRIVALSGPSGYGKSSIVLFIADKCKNIKWRKQFFVYPIDTRTASSPLFIVEAIRTGIQRAIEGGFIHDISTEISIDSVEDPFSSESMKNCLEYLERQNKVLMLFFDQFEELFVKESLYDTFEAFRRFAAIRHYRE